MLKISERVKGWMILLNVNLSVTWNIKREGLAWWIPRSHVALKLNFVASIDQERRNSSCARPACIWIHHPVIQNTYSGGYQHAISHRRHFSRSSVLRSVRSRLQVSFNGCVDMDGPSIIQWGVTLMSALLMFDGFSLNSHGPTSGPREKYAHITQRRYWVTRSMPALLREPLFVVVMSTLTGAFRCQQLECFLCVL